MSLSLEFLTGGLVVGGRKKRLKRNPETSLTKLVRLPLTLETWDRLYRRSQRWNYDSCYTMNAIMIDCYRR
ncbi:hypothetical protein G9P44_000583 [Scheffersomyces stipitis]|nr:hypothetical protein G9P44_000583 [Scheffersomyces stipitis]